MENICYVPGTYTWTDGSSSALFASTSVWTGSALPTASPATLSDTNDWVYMTTAGKWSVTGASSSGSATTKYEVSNIIIYIRIIFKCILGSTFARSRTKTSSAP